MSGHSKWANIKHRKGAQDAKRGKVFTRLAREVIIAAKIGGAELENNPRLRMAVQKAKSMNMPNDNISRAIQRAVGGAEGDIEEVTYEAYAQAGVAVIIDCATDNKNRTLPEVRNIVSKSGGNMAEKGAVSYMFAQKGLFVFEESKANEDQVMEVALEYDVDDIKANEDGSVEVICDPACFADLQEAFIAAGLESMSADVTMIASVEVPIDQKVIASKILSLVNKLDDHDDVQNVYHNADISDDLLDQMVEEGLI